MIEQRPYQQEAIAWLSTRRRGVVVAPAGSGKTLVAAGALARVVCSKPRTQKVRVGWLANTIEQVSQAEAAINSFPEMLPFIEIKIACAAAATDWSDRDVLIVDECFPAGTLIDGVPIEEIKVGDLVLAFDHAKSRVVLSAVLGVMRRNYERSYFRVNLEGGTSFVCTENHPVFTVERGYISATNLLQLHEDGVKLTLYETSSIRKRNTAKIMSELRERNTAKSRKAVSRSEFLRQQLFRRVQHESLCVFTTSTDKMHNLWDSGCLQTEKGSLSGLATRNGLLHRHLPGYFYEFAQQRDCQKNERLLAEKNVRNKLKNNACNEPSSAGNPFGANDAKQSHDESGDKSKNGSCHEGQDFSFKRRKRSTHKTTTCCSQSNQTSNGSGDPDCSCKGEVREPSNLLQGGFGKSESETRNRNRRSKSSPAEVEIFRSPENQRIKRVGLASVEVYKQGSGSRPDWVPEENTVFNLHVEGQNNYFANGVLVHNCHHAGSADGWFHQTISCEGARWGFTATPPDDPEALSIWQNLFGEVFTVNRQDISANLSPARVVLLDDTDPDLQKSMDEEIGKTFRRRKRYSAVPEGELRAMVMWQVCIEMGIVKNRARNAAAVRVARQHSNDSVLILVNRVEHGLDLVKQIPNSICCFAGMGAKKRRAALEGFKDGSVKCVVATSLCDEGFDCPRANVLIMVSAGKSRIKTEQRSGRVLRLFAGKTGALIYDFIDRQHGLMYKHSQRRIEIYKELNYEITGPRNMGTSK